MNFVPLIKGLLITLGIGVLGWSFWLSPSWLQLCAGLALFLFGMQCLEEGLHQLAGSRLEALLSKSTDTPFKSLVFGAVGTTLLQSSTLVSLLTIAFISTGLIQLAAGIAIIFGANLGATTGIWLLAAAGQNFSLSPLALPLLVTGVLSSFFSPQLKAAGRILLGIAFIFLGIDQIKTGFSSLDQGLSTPVGAFSGLLGQAVFVGIGTLATLILQSSHASLMLTLTALATGQIELWQGFAIAVGANIGSSLSTAIVGILNGNRSGQRLALAHAVFNLTTSCIVFFLLPFCGPWITGLAGLIGAQENRLIQLALFQTLFNLFGVLLFWPLQQQLARQLVRWLPDKQEPSVLIASLSADCSTDQPVRARYLNEAALASPETAACAVMQELRHLERLSLEVICHALYQPVSQLQASSLDEHLLQRRPDPRELDAEHLYRCYIKGVYADILDFMSHLDTPMNANQRQFWRDSQRVALQLVEAVKDAKHLQKNLGRFLRDEGSRTQVHYLALRRQLLQSLRYIREVSLLDTSDPHWNQQLQHLKEQAEQYDQQFRQHLFVEVRARQLDSLHASSLLNDLGYVSHITQGLYQVLLLSKQRPFDVDGDHSVLGRDDLPSKTS